MQHAICFKCGYEKSGPLESCRHCNVAPQTNSECAVSLALSHHFSTETQLVQYHHELSRSSKLSVPQGTLVRALSALKDPRFRATLRAEQDAPQTTAQISTSPLPEPFQRALPLHGQSGTARRAIVTVLDRSPFATLGATTRDDRKRIVELAEEKSLELDPEVSQKARSALTNPRTRLSAEMGWLPGVSPRKAFQLVEDLRSDPMAARETSGVPTLAHLNLLAAALEFADGGTDATDLTNFIREVAGLSEVLNPAEILRDINEDRAVSGFPAVQGIDQIEAELGERKRYYRNSIKDALNRLPTKLLIRVLTDAVDGATSGGEDHGPALIDDLVDSYEGETQSVLHREADNIDQLVKAARESAKAGEAAVKPLIDKLETVARNWDMIAQPIQLSAKARGIDHEPSRDLAYKIRSLGIDLFNDHNMLVQSRRLTGLLQELFREVPDVSERVEQDFGTLAEISKEREQAAAREEEWVREITYHAQVGLIFKEELSISPQGIRWKGCSVPLESITRVRWGGVRRSINGIPTGTEYTIAFGDSHSEQVVELRNESTYSSFLAALWRAVCIRLVLEMVAVLEKGGSFSIGDFVVEDDGVTLVRHKFLGSNERVRLTWDDVTVWSADGSFVIGKKGDKKVYGSASYILGWNTHLIEHVIRGGFKKGIRRLSDYLKD